MTVASKNANSITNSGRYDLQELKNAATGHWSEIHQQLCGVSGDCLEGRHGPCPIHGGKDKWRVFDDYHETGGAICNDCGRMADGISVVQRLLGIPFVDALKRIADCLGVQPKHNTARTTKEPQDPAKHLVFAGQPESMAIVFCNKKKGITPSALWAVGAQYAMYRGRHPVFAIPAKNNQNEVVGYCLYHALGREFPNFEKGKTKPSSWSKIKITKGSKPGWIGNDVPSDAKIGIKTEGPSCCLSLLSRNLPNNVFVCCNLSGAEQDPAQAPELLERFRNIPEAFIVHDMDEPGQRGATYVTNNHGRSRPGWGPAIAAFSKSTRNVKLPFDPQPSHGNDLRDWIVSRVEEGQPDYDIYCDFLSRARRGDAMEPAEIKSKHVGDSKSDAENLSSISNYRIEQYEEDGAEKRRKVAIPLSTIGSQVVVLMNGWPKRVDDTLFVLDSTGTRTKPISRMNALFSWVRTSVPIYWTRGDQFPAKEELLEYLQNNAEKYESVEHFPHFPPIQGCYYAHPPITPTANGFLEKLLDYFCPESPSDRQLIKALTVSGFVGGPNGSTPGFLITAKGGQGNGKTTLASIVGMLTGGTVDFAQDSKPEDITKRLLNGQNLFRVLLIDNVKASRFSSAPIEALITAKSISGSVLYKGNASRPNRFLWVLTYNAPSLSRDLAQRLIEIRLGAPTYRSTWLQEVESFVSKHQWEIISDIAGFFEKQPVERESQMRWSHWEREVLFRLEDPASVIATIKQRELENDGDQKLAREIMDHSFVTLAKFYEMPFSVHVPSSIMSQFVSEAMEEPKSMKETASILSRLQGMGLFRGTISTNPCRTHGRGYLVTHGHGTPVQYDLENRFQKQNSF